jgi:mannose-6-phosphate isomerase-like protein (cupin superfamily)
METVRVLRDEEFSTERYNKVSPFRTGRIAFSIYDFKPWQNMPMRRSPRSDTVLYVVQGQGTAFVGGDKRPLEPNTAVFVPAGSTYGMLSGEADTVVISVQGPTPIDSIYDGNLWFRCPACQLESPVTTKAYNGCVTVCPRCTAGLKLYREAAGFRADQVSGPRLTEVMPGLVETAVEAGSRAAGPEGDAEGAGQVEEEKLAFNVYDFGPWQALPMRRSPASDTVLYVVQGQGIAFVGDEERSIDAHVAIYVPAGAMFGALSADRGMIMISVQGPTPVETQPDETLAYSCPACQLDTPVTTGTYDGCITVCPRCNVKLKLRKEKEGFRAEETTEKAPTEAEVS